MGLEETAPHQNLQAPHHSQPHLPQPLLRLQKPQKEARVSFLQVRFGKGKQMHHKTFWVWGSCSSGCGCWQRLNQLCDVFTYSTTP